MTTSRRSVISRRNKKAQNDEIWYEDLLEIVTEDLEELHEEDLIIAIESSIYATEFRKEETEGLGSDGANNNEEEEEQKRKKRFTKQWERKCLSMMRTVKGLFQRMRGGNDSGEDVNDSSNDSDSNEEEEGDVQGLFGTKTSTSSWPLNRFLDRQTKSGKKMLIAFIAWGMACFGLLIALIFLTRDFAKSRKETAMTVQYIPNETLNLPKLWFCTADTQLPLFTSVPPTYPGTPIIWIDYVRGTNVHLNITYPDTLELPQFTVEMIDKNGQTCNGSTVMNAQMFSHDDVHKPLCFHCISLTRNPPLAIEKNSRSSSKLGRLASLVSLRISQQSFISRCRTAQLGVPVTVLAFFRSQLKMHAVVLEQLGVLNFSGLNATSGEHDGLLWPAYRQGGRNTSLDYLVYDVADMFCNVYIFAGFFYPATAADIRYRFNRKVFRWERTGSGPFYPEVYGDQYGKEATKYPPINSTVTMGEEFNRKRAIFFGTTLYVMTNASKLGGSEMVAAMQPLEAVSVSFSRNVVNGKENMQSHVLRSVMEEGASRSINFLYFVHFKSNDYFTRNVSQQSAISWTAFLADFFGLTSLFLDLSVYTIIVSPIAGRNKARKKRRKKMLRQRSDLVKRGYAVGA